MRTIVFLTAVIFVLTFTVFSAGIDAADINNVEKNTSDIFKPDIFSYNLNYRTQIDLNGKWQFRRDPNELGLNQGWHQGSGEFTESINVPGAPQAQGIGSPAARQRTCFWEEPFWVRKTCQLPQLDKNKRIWLRIGGIFPAAEIYINGNYVGYTKSSRTQLRADVTGFVKPAAENLIVIKVCKMPKVRLDGLFEWVEFGVLWTGVYEPVRFEITDEVSVIDAYIQPRLASDKIDTEVELSKATPENMTATLKALDGEKVIGSAKVKIPKGDTKIKAEVKLKDFNTWSPEHPQLYTLDIALTKNTSKAPVDKAGLRFGMREIAVKGERFYLNGKPLYMRCFGDDSFYPETLCPSSDKQWYLSRLKRARAFGMNAAKGCAEIMPRSFVEAADEAGIIVFQDMPFGVSGNYRANRNTINKEFRDYYSYELDGLIKQSRNHASVMVYGLSDEMGLNEQNQESFDFYNKQLPLQVKKTAPHALVIDCFGYINTEDSAKGKRVTDFYASVHPKWMKEVLDETEMITDHKHPMLLHEYNWWSCYQDPADKDKYKNTQIRTDWLDTMVKTARENGQSELIPLYRKNSLWLQALCQKDGLEYARRNPDVQGWIFWLLIDFHRYSEGLFDDFWNPKNVTAQEFMQCNGDTIILLAKEGNRCLVMGVDRQIPLAVSHYGEQKYPNAKLHWKISGGPAFKEGEMTIPDIPQGELTQAGFTQFDLPKADKAYKFELEVSLHHEGRIINTNKWSFWAFPEVREQLRNVTAEENAGKTIENDVFLRTKSAGSSPIPAGISLVIADSVDQALTDYIDTGGKCLLIVRGVEIENQVCYYQTTTFYKTFRTIPWNAGDSGNSGTLINFHPSLDMFPHEGMCDLQFISMIPGVLPMEFSPLRKYGVTPIIRSIDHFLANRSNAYMLEFNVGKGKVLATTLGILEKLETMKTFWEQGGQVFGTNKQIEAKYLLQCLIDYEKGPNFSPASTVPKDEFIKLFSSRQNANQKSPDQILKDKGNLE